MKKLFAIAIVAVMAIALCTTAFASHAATADLGEVLLEEKFDGEALGEGLGGWSGYKIEGSKLHLGWGGSWIESSPAAWTTESYKSYVATFKFASDGRDCYCGFGIRVNEGDTHGALMNGGRFNVPSAAEISNGIAFDLFLSPNQNPDIGGTVVGIAFCNGAPNGDAPQFTVPNPEGFDGKAETEVKVIDAGDKITVFLGGKELVTIELSGLADGKYTKAVAYDAAGKEVFNGAVSVCDQGRIVFYQRNDYVTIDDFVISAIAEKAEDPGEQPGEQPGDQPSNPPTADASVIAIAAVACIALAGVVVAKKVR